MSSLPPAPMSGHFFWSDETETHIANLFTDFAQIPRNKFFLAGMFRYLDPVTLQELNPKVGFTMSGMDHYYINAVGAGPQNLEYAMYNDPVTGSTTTTVYSVLGYAQETKRTGVRVNTFAAQRIWNGATVADDVMARVNARLWQF
jgi:hypothetical protein